MLNPARTRNQCTCRAAAAAAAASSACTLFSLTRQLPNRSHSVVICKAATDRGTPSAAGAEAAGQQQQQQRRSPPQGSTRPRLHSRLKPSPPSKPNTHPQHDKRLDRDGKLAVELLKSLGQYTPTGLSDGPASLSQVRPYNAAEVQHALQHSVNLLQKFNVWQLSNIAAALAAAGHLDPAFMQQLAYEAERQLAAQQPATGHIQALAQLRAICFLAVAYARLGLRPVGLLQQIAVSGTKLMQRHQLCPSKRTHGLHLALLAAAFAALKLHPPQLFKSIGELLKQQRQVLSLLGPHETMLLLWAFGKVDHQDPPTMLLLTQRATTQVGQFDCQGLAHAYTQCATAGITAPPLLAALRKATRQRLHSMQPAQLTAVLTALAGLGQQDLLLLDDVARAVYNKAANFSAAQLSAVFTACSLLSYRNPWLLDQASKMLVSRKLQKAPQLSAAHLADILAASNQLGYSNPLLLTHLGSVAAQTLCASWSAADVAVVLQGYCLLKFYQPLLLYAAAKRLLQLASSRLSQHSQCVAMTQQQQEGMQQQQQHVPWLIAAAYALASMPVARGSAAERSTHGAAVQAVAAAAAVEDGRSYSCSCSEWVKLCIAVLLAGCWIPSATAAGEAEAIAGAAVQGDQQQRPPDPQQQQQQQQSDKLQQVMLRHACDALSAAAAAGVEGLETAAGPELLLLIQLLWLREQKEVGNPLSNQDSQQMSQHGRQQQQQQQQKCLDLADHDEESSQSGAALQQFAPQWAEQLQTGRHRDSSNVSRSLAQQQIWQLGLPEQLVEDLVRSHLSKQQQQLQQREEGAVLLRAVVAAIRQYEQPGPQAFVVQSPYAIPGSPVTVPAAVVPFTWDMKAQPAATAAAEQQQQQQRAYPKQQAAAAGSLQAEQQQQQRQEQVFQIAKVQLRPRLQLPNMVLWVLQDCQARGKPAAIFVAGQGPSALQSWYTSSEPQQLLPLAEAWQQGLVERGWSVVLIQQEVERHRDEE